MIYLLLTTLRISKVENEDVFRGCKIKCVQVSVAHEILCKPSNHYIY